ncbi:hypothetical protein JCM10207_002044 [Rhodosporidiobolus poonsookiae]
MATRSALKTILRQLEPYGACDVADALTRLKHPYGGFVSGLKLRSPSPTQGKILGPAFPVLFERNEHKATKPSVSGHYIDAIPKDTVLFLSAPPDLPNAVYGGIMSARLKHVGALGTVVDGRIRDIDEQIALEWPVFSRDLGTTAGAELCFASQLNVPVPLQSPSRPGVMVHPGDILVGDANGLVAIPSALAEEVVRILPELAEVDRQCLEDVKAGRPVAETFKERRGRLRC